MSLKRKTIIFVGGVALAAWFSAAMTPGRPPATFSAVRSAPIDAKGAVLAGEIERLHERLRPDTVPREATRNPFAFRSSRRAAPASSDRTAAAQQPPAVAAAESPRLRLTLSGIAEDSGGKAGDVDRGQSAPVRTAIIAGNGQLFLVKEGETVIDRDVTYKVLNISADSAELIDVRDSTIHRLVLK